MERPGVTPEEVRDLAVLIIDGWTARNHGGKAITAAQCIAVMEAQSD